LSIFKQTKKTLLAFFLIFKTWDLFFLIWDFLAVPAVALAVAPAVGKPMAADGSR